MFQVTASNISDSNFNCNTICKVLFDLLVRDTAAQEGIIISGVIDNKILYEKTVQRLNEYFPGAEFKLVG